MNAENPYSPTHLRALTGIEGSEVAGVELREAPYLTQVVVDVRAAEQEMRAYEACGMSEDELKRKRKEAIKELDDACPYMYQQVHITGPVFTVKPGGDEERDEATGLHVKAYGYRWRTNENGERRIVQSFAVARDGDMTLRFDEGHEVLTRTETTLSAEVGALEVAYEREGDELEQSVRNLSRRLAEDIDNIARGSASVEECIYQLAGLELAEYLPRGLDEVSFDARVDLASYIYSRMYIDDAVPYDMTIGESAFFYDPAGEPIVVSCDDDRPLEGTMRAYVYISGVEIVDDYRVVEAGVCESLNSPAIAFTLSVVHGESGPKPRDSITVLARNVVRCPSLRDNFQA